ncbi:uncharacterized protein LOC132904396 [Amyelois transitella]|uniref:uncharacterized protein LOC132904396 n=1 Tax=Amyelois transitella TaxID=680683 RepID=UPI00298FCC59|nr:uncharacterized protein LOC132904396 [Amyelois transitella]
MAIDKFKPDIVAINESWLKEGQELCAPAAPGYRLYHVSRPIHMKGGKGGGVAFYVKRNVRVRILKHPIANIEQMWLSTRINGAEVLVGTAYRPDWIGVDPFLDALTESIMYFSNFDYVALLGDFNIDMSDNSNTNRPRVVEFIEYLELKQIITEPTHLSRLPNKTLKETLIDLICTNVPIHHVSVTNITASLGHYFICTELLLKKPKDPPRFIVSRAIKSIDVNAFDRDLNDIDWESVKNQPSVDLMVEKFNHKLLALFDKHAPLKLRKAKPNHSLPWVTGTYISKEDHFFYNNHKFNDSSKFNLETVTECDVANFIFSIKSNAIGPDGISRDMVLLTLPNSLDAITHIINTSIVTGTVPCFWKRALVTPIPKTSKPSSYSDLRPISILPYLSKILEKSVQTQLVKFLEANNVLPVLQSGFRRNHGTTTALLDVTDNILAAQDRGQCTILTLLDFSRAFDSLNIELLLSKLAYYGLDPSSVAWFRSFLGGRSQSVKLARENGLCLFSQSLPVKHGVPQGSILGPLLFIIFSADITRVIKHCKYHLYADDVQLYISDVPNNISQAVIKLNEDLGRIAEWSLRNSLTLNPKKSNYIVLGSRFQLASIINEDLGVKIGNDVISRAMEVRNLGLIVDPQLRFESHVASLVKSCFYRLKVIYKIRNLLTEEVRIRLCETLILSRLNFGDIVYGPRLLCKTQRLIQRIQNACARFCFNIPPRSHISPYLIRATMLNMETRRQLHLASLMFGVMKFHKPNYLFSKLIFFRFRGRSGPCRSTRPILSVQPHKTVAFEGSFRHQATRCWNDIPPPIRLLSSIYSFKKNLKSFLREKQALGIPKRLRLGFFS